ncbi:hypothetical protein Y1Q_0022617 [Alligator mississippiensis]|uniref:Uncharacterized protein n=1 Tax=Alligator mississippiensis TaxID=8496 RepID=A0A151N804_ALLMI|nr:hypothetical protein Y1Q_0022617 [Alligator mississippiensis]
MTAEGSIAVIPYPDLLINVTCTVQNPASSSSTTASVKALCAANTPAQASLLSYCQVKRLILLLVLGLLITRTVAVHIMPGKLPKQD